MTDYHLKNGQVNLHDMLAAARLAKRPERRVQIDFTITGTQVLDTDKQQTNEEGARQVTAALEGGIRDIADFSEYPWQHSFDLHVDVTVKDVPTEEAA